MRPKKILLVCVSAVCGVMAEAFTHRRTTTKALVLSESSPCGIYGEKIATGTLFLGTLKKLGKATFSFVMYVCLYFRMDQIGSH
jgi:hypothetical protein